MQYIFRRPQFPVIVVVDDRAFRVQASHQLGRLLNVNLNAHRGLFGCWIGYGAGSQC
jgi:hypothetical protein